MPMPPNPFAMHRACVHVILLWFSSDLAMQRIAFLLRKPLAPRDLLNVTAAASASMHFRHMRERCPTRYLML